MRIFQNSMLYAVCVMDLFLSLTELSVCVALGREGCLLICFLLASKNTDRVSIVFTLKECFTSLWMLIPRLQ